MINIKNIKKNLEKDAIQKIVVGAVILNKEKVLALQRIQDDFMGGLIEIPSGTVDEGEDIDEALKREVQEKTGLIIQSIDQYIGFFDYVSGSGKRTRQLNFLVSVEHQDILLSSEHDSYQWLSFEDVTSQKIDMSPETKDIVTKAFQLSQN